MKNNLRVLLPVLAGFVVLFGFTAQAEAGRPYHAPAQCYESFNLGGLRYTYPVACPSQVKIIQPRGPVTYYQTRGGGVTIIKPGHKPAPVYYHGRKLQHKHPHRHPPSHRHGHHHR